MLKYEELVSSCSIKGYCVIYKILLSNYFLLAQNFSGIIKRKNRMERRDQNEIALIKTTGIGVQASLKLFLVTAYVLYKNPEKLDRVYIYDF